MEPAVTSDDLIDRSSVSVLGETAEPLDIYNDLFKENTIVYYTRTVM